MIRLPFFVFNMFFQPLSIMSSRAGSVIIESVVNVHKKANQETADLLSEVKGHLGRNGVNVQQTGLGECVLDLEFLPKTLFHAKGPPTLRSVGYENGVTVGVPSV